MRLVYRSVGWLVWIYAWLVRASARWSYEGLAHRAAALAHGRVIYALWHQDGPFFCAALGREHPRKLTLLALGGDKLQVFLGFADLDRFRVRATSAIGAMEETAASMAALQQDIRSGCWAVITPDGPAGPPRICKSGIVGIARAVDGVVLPVSLAGSGYVRLRGWDQARIPLPFTRIDVRFGTPIVAAHHDDADLRRTIEDGLEACSLWRPARQGGIA